MFKKVLKTENLVAIVLFIIPFFWFGNHQLIIGGETYTSIAPQNTFINSLSVWFSYFGFGSSNLFFTPVVNNFLVYVLHTLLPISIVQKTFLGAFLAVPFLGMYHYLKSIRSAPSSSILLGALFYVFNPFYVMMFQWFPSYGYMFSLTPFILLEVKNLFDDPGIRTVTLFKLFVLFFILSVTSLNIALFGLVLIVMSIYITVILIVSTRKRENVLKVLSLIFVLLSSNAFWILPFTQLLKSTFANAVVYVSNFSAASLLKTPILGALTLFEFYWFDKTDGYGKPFFEYASWYRDPGIIIMFIVYAALLFILLRKRSASTLLSNSLVVTIFFSLLFVSGVFLTKGTAPPFGDLYKILLQKIQYFGIYRASDIKFPFLLVLALPYFITASVSLISNTVWRRFITLSGFVLILFLGSPFIFAKIFTNIISIPDYWYKMAARFNEKTEQGRVLILPKNTSAFDYYTWGYSGAWMSAQLFNYSSINLTPGYGSSRQEGNFKTIKRLYTSLEKNNVSLIAKNLSEFNIRYILFRHDVDSRFVDDKIAESSLATLADKIASDGPLTLYKVRDRFLSSQILSNDIPLERVSSTEYKFKIAKNVRTAEVALLESYDDNWKIYSDKSDGLKFFSLHYLFQKPINAQHSLLYGYANKWVIDKPEIDSGSYTLIYRPQLFYYTGLFMTFSAFGLLLGIALLSVVKSISRTSNAA